MPDCASHSSVGRLLHSRYSWLSSLCPENTRDGLDELRPLLVPVLLVEALAADAVGHADHGERAVGEVRQHERRHLREVAQQVALGQRRLLERRVGRPVDAVEMGELERVAADRRSWHSPCLLSSCCDHLVDLRAASRRLRLPARFGGAPHRLRSMSSRRRRNTGARSEPSPVQPWNFTSATTFGSTQVVGALSSGLLGERIGLAAAAARAARAPARATIVEARADVRGVVQLAALPVADQQRAQRRARALPLRIAADDEVARCAST